MDAREKIKINYTKCEKSDEKLNTICLTCACDRRYKCWTSRDWGEVLYSFAKQINLHNNDTLKIT